MIILTNLEELKNIYEEVFNFIVVLVLLGIFFLRGALPRYKLDGFIRLVWQSLLFIVIL